MGYANDRAQMSYTQGATTSLANNRDVATYPVPANKEIEIYGLKTYIGTQNGWACGFALTDSAGTNVLASVSAQGNSGSVNTAPQLAGGPLRFTPAAGLGGGDSVLRLRVAGAGGISTFVGTVLADFSLPPAR